MNSASLARLLLLAAIWGGSFLFMRISAPAFGPVMMIACRVGFAAIFLAGVSALMKRPMDLRRHWKHYLILGLFNSALPFLLFAFAARTLSASILSVLNATAPIWGALIAAVWSRHALSARTTLGLVLGMSGVGLLVGFDHIATEPGAGLAIAAALAASFSYGLASNYARSAKSVEPIANAHGSMWASVLIVAPLVPFFPMTSTPTPGVMGAAVALGVLCSGVAYLLYFRLIRDVGATSALTVTFLIPVFGILWGTLFLSEVIGWYTVCGSAIVIVGTALVTGYRPTVWPFAARAVAAPSSES